jgi:8-oxo-dGTP pyrophosphatase MutT (NUDIX family)
VILDELLENSKTNWTETEWEFPKGRKNYQERDIDCALREFEEETGISKENINIIENV